MAYKLTSEEKALIINQHLKNLEFNKYGLRVSLIEMGSGISAKKESIEDMENQISSINAKQNALIIELNSLEESIDG